MNAFDIPVTQLGAIDAMTILLNTPMHLIGPKDRDEYGFVMDIEDLADNAMVGEKNNRLVVRSDNTFEIYDVEVAGDQSGECSSIFELSAL